MSDRFGTPVSGGGLVPPRVASLTEWVEAGIIGPAEVHGTEVLLRHGSPGGADPMVVLAAALALRAPMHGHSCIDLGSIVEGLRADRLVADRSVAVPMPPTPSLDRWLGALAASPLVRVAAGHDLEHLEDELDDRPFVLCGPRLATQRQWVDEGICAARLLALAGDEVGTDADLVDGSAGLLDRLFPPDPAGAVDAQRVAVEHALRSRLTVMVGGPGTGKTHTVARLLAVLLAEAARRGQPTAIGLAAPTGKAAARMRSAVAAAVRDASDQLPPGIAGALTAVPAVTLHRLLGPLPAVRTRFSHDAATPLPYDVVVVDETSMVALPMMARLLDALRPGASLVLVGDPDQLESVEAGAVLADVVSAASSSSSPLHGHVVRLTRTHRQAHDSPIGPLADRIRAGDAEGVLAALMAGVQGPDPDSAPALSFIEHLDPLGTDDGAGVRDLVLPLLVEARTRAVAGDASRALEALGQAKVLCAHRTGRHGASSWTRTIQRWVHEALPVLPADSGHPLLITRNDVRNGLSNGDAGVVIASSDAGSLAAFEIEGSVRTFGLAQLDRVETSYAMTVHKSQGSEYPTVIVVLPPAASPMARRELLYTAVTRARQRVVVVGTRESVLTAVRTPGRRTTGLADALM